MFRKAAKGSFGSFSAREALFAAFFAGGFLMATWITRTPAIREGLGLSIAEMGLVFLGLSLGSIPSLIFAPVLIHRAGARVMTLLGEVLMLLGVFFAALPLALPMPLPGGVVTAFGLGLVGFGSVFLDIAMNVAAGVIEARRGKPVLTTLHACFSLGEAVGAFFGFGCVYLAVSPMTHFLMALGLMALVFLLSTLRLGEVEALVRASGEEAQKKTGAAKPKLRITGGLITAVIVVFVVALCEGTANDWLPILLRESMNASTSFAALAFAVFASGLAVVRFSGTFWLRRFGKRRVLMGSALLALIGLTVIIFFKAPLFVMLGVVFWAAGAALGFPVALSAGAAMGEGDPAARMSLLSSAGYGAFLAGPPTLGFIGEGMGLSASFGLVALLMLLPVLLARRMTPAEGEVARRVLERE
ncbi:MFS transporter [uncultured Sutterella sp.]|uniref:MFS transporter n=1 Tax=uncultured Sutterella sp. TaxID=286133 RepID=UPI00261B9817|nr:MFS transporter [uncultured Sutterella sp.]